MNQKPIKIALLGIGKMGQNHLRNLSMLKNIEVAFIYDVNKQLLESTARAFGVNALTSDKELESSLKKCDGAIIVTPTFTHYEYIQRVSDNVKHIFVEKPLTDTLETTNIIVGVAREKNLKIQVGFIERYNPAIIALRELLRNRKVYNIDFSRTNKMSSRITDVDVVMDLMIHDIDLALLLNGAVAKVEAHGVVIGGMIEYARAIFHHKNGTFSNVLASRITEKRIRHICVTAQDFYVDCNLLSKEVKVNRQTLEQHLENIHINSMSEYIEVRPQEALLLELMDFASMCRDEESSVFGVSAPSEIDGKNAMVLANEIQKQIHHSAESCADSKLGGAND